MARSQDEAMESRFAAISGLAAIALGAMAMVGFAHADDAMTMAGYFNAKKAGGMDWANTEVFLTGIANGFTAANAELTARHQQQLFCSPVIGLNFDNIDEIIEREYSSTPAVWQPTSTMRMVLLFGLMKAFPCK
jgi:hypothetical protein